MGLECDKMSSLAATVQWNNYFKVISDSLAKHHLPLHGMAMDSHEAGSQNWTPGFDKEFHKRRGYDLKHLLPAMMGHIIGTSEETNGILYDVRRTIADLIADNYYGTLNKICQESGVSFTAQATGNALCIVADPIQAKGKVDIPQGEFWAIHPDGNYDIKESSSAAHLYGKKQLLQKPSRMQSSATHSPILKHWQTTLIVTASMNSSCAHQLINPGWIKFPETQEEAVTIV